MVDGGIYRHDFVAQAVVSGLMQAQLATEVPMFSVSLTPHNFQPADEFIDFTASISSKGSGSRQSGTADPQLAAGTRVNQRL